MDKQKKDLSLIPIEDMIEEIRNRTICFIMAYELPEEKEKHNKFNTWHGHGEWLAACGLATVLHNDVLNNWNNQLETLERINNEGIF